eukprot:749572_1
MATANNDTYLKQQIHKLKADYEALQKKSKAEYEALCTKSEHQQKQIEKLKQLQESNQPQAVHSKEFWSMIGEKCKSDHEYLKELVKKGEIKMNETDDDGSTFLLYAAHEGAYELTQLAINLGSDVNHVDNAGKDALQHARDGAWSH